MRGYWATTIILGTALVTTLLVATQAQDVDPAPLPPPLEVSDGVTWSTDDPSQFSIIRETLPDGRIVFRIGGLCGPKGTFTVTP